MRVVIPDYDRESKTVDPRVEPEDDKQAVIPDPHPKGISCGHRESGLSVIPDYDRESKTVDPRGY